ncbi:MAG TPA: alpha-2-macroglobulin, partial [Azospirillaceae bacterium]|nr:alpha-2-macroglobulin [Azospirillaceae bacterium]
MVPSLLVRSLAVLVAATAPLAAQEAAAPVTATPAAAQAQPATQAQPGPGAPPAGAPAAPAAPKPEDLPFGLTGVEVAAERDHPQACFAFNRPLMKPRRGAKGSRYEQFVAVERAGAGASEHPLVVRDNELCVENLAHGQRYTVTLKEGFPSADARERLAAAEQRQIDVANRKPALAFRGAGYVLPRIGPEGLPLRTINVDRARLQVLRINDRALVEQIYYGRINQTLTDFDVGQIVEQKGELVWRGEMAIGSKLNQAVVTPFPLEAVVGEPQPGVYVAVAEDARIKTQGWDTKATQWFVVSDLGLTTFSGANGVMAFARSLSSAKPQAGVELRLVARDNRELGKVTTAEDGTARFDPALVQGTGAVAPQVLFAYGPAGDFGFLDLGAEGIDLSDRGVRGRRAPGALDAWIGTDRGVYRPGETVHLSGLLRDADANAVAGRTLTLKLFRPDGMETDRRPLQDQGAGGYATALVLPGSAFPGQWKASVHAEPDGAAIGEVQFQVEDFAPPRLEFELSADRARLGADGRAVLSIAGRHLYGTPADSLPGELSVTLRAAETPYPEFAGYRFGLAQETFDGEKRPLPGFTTNAEGDATVAVEVGARPETTKVLEAVFRATVFDIGGRPISRELAVPMANQPFAIGIRPRFAGDALPEGASAGFDVVALSPEGKPVDRPGLSYDLFEEEYEYVWYEANGRWDYRTTVRDRRLTGGTLDVAAAAPAGLEEQVKAGRYRLEVFDPATGVATSVRFSAGWWVAAKLGDTPDTVEVVAAERSYRPGDTARVFVRPPYAGTVLVTVADRQVRRTFIREVGTDGAFLDVPVEADWTAGAYVVATAFAPADPTRRALPRRAIGVGWLAVAPEARALEVTLEAPAETRSRATLSVPVAVSGLEPGASAFVTVSAVDEAVLALTGRPAADPVDWYFGRRRLAVEMRDVYGRLRQATAAPVPAGPRPAAERAAARPGIVPSRFDKVTALFSGVVAVGPDGRAQVPLEVPQFAGRLHLTATAWSAGRIGRAEAAVPVRDPVTADLSLPRFLAPGDKAQLALTLENLSGKPGAYTATLTAQGPVVLDNPTVQFQGMTKGRRVTARRTLSATGVGEGRIVMTVKAPDGSTTVREIPVSVRPAIPFATRRQAGDIAPGQGLILSSGLAQGLRPETATVALSVSSLPEMDLAGMLLALDRQKPSGAERIVSRALPLLYVNETAKELGLPADAALKERVQQATDRLLSLQRADGAFAQWTPQGPAEPWLTAAAMDFLTRARDAGYLVPEVPYRKGVDWLVRTVGNSWVEDEELPGRAYALYAAARARAIDVSAVRYFQDTFWNRLPTRLARAQVGGALALLGDGARAQDAFSRVEGPRLATAGMRDFGSELRDRAAAIAIQAEHGVDTGRLVDQAREVQGMLRDPSDSSAQEQSWLVLAGDALIQRAGPMRLALDGQPAAEVRPFVRQFPATGKAPSIVNAGEQPVSRTVTVAGVPT